MNLPVGPDPERALVPAGELPRVEHDIDVGRLAKGLWRRRWRIAVSAMLVASVAAAGLLTLRPDTYKAEAHLVVQPVRSTFAGTPLASHVMGQADMDTVLQLISSELIYARAAEALRLAPADLESAIELHPQERSSLLVVGAKASSAAGAAELANGFLDAITGYFHDDVAQQIDAAKQEVTARVKLAQQRVTEAQEKLSAYVGQFDFVDESELPKAIDRVHEAEKELGQLEARSAAIKSQMGKTHELIEKEEKFVRSVSSSSGGGGVSVAPARATPSVPIPWLKAEAEKRRVGSTSTSTVSPNPVRQSLYIALLEYETEAAALDVEIDRQRGELATLRGQQAKLPALKREYQSLAVQRDHALEAFDAALSAQAAVDALAAIPDPIFRVLTRAQPPEKPERTKRYLLVALAGLLGLAGSFAWAFFAEFRDTRVRAATEVERLGIPVVTRIRLNGSTSLSSDAQEGLEQAAYAVRRYGRQHGAQCVLVTSATPDEGKTRVAREVARILVEWGESVLRIDANFRDHSASPGQLERYLTGESEQPSLLKFRNGLYAITCGGARADAPALLASDWMDRLLDRSRASFSTSIVDGPAMQPGVDAELLAEKVDAVLLVVRAEFVEMGAIRHAVAKLRELGVHVLGAVMVDGNATMRADARREESV